MATVSLPELSEYMAFADEIAQKAGAITLEYFRKELSVEFKNDKSPVTIADKACEEFVRAEIMKRYPTHGIVGEEFGTYNEQSSYTWVIDPIDGTKSFIHHIPLYTVLIALLVDNEPCLGVIHNPPLTETVLAGKGMGCFFNGKPCRVSTTKALKESYIQVTDMADLARYYPLLTQRLLPAAMCCRTWGDAYGYLLVATGRSDAMIDPIMNIWDIAPLKTIITEAGGMFTDLRGNDSGLGTTAIATNGQIHHAILSMVDEVTA